MLLSQDCRAAAVQYCITNPYCSQGFLTYLAFKSPLPPPLMEILSIGNVVDSQIVFLYTVIII